MSKEYDTVLEAKKSVKAHISFFESILAHLKGHDKVLRTRAVWAAWCLHRYINDHLINDINHVMAANAPKDGENVQ
jgi:hypothetical protein